MGISPTILGFLLREFIWDIPILIFAYVLFCGPITLLEDLAAELEHQAGGGVGSGVQFIRV